MFRHPSLWDLTRHSPPIIGYNDPTNQSRTNSRFAALDLSIYHGSESRSEIPTPVPCTIEDITEPLITPPPSPEPTPVPRRILILKKKFIFIRHAEGYHNSLYANGLKDKALMVRDPQLTPKGHRQVFIYQ
jgi:hypothetical protein